MAINRIKRWLQRRKSSLRELSTMMPQPLGDQLARTQAAQTLAAGPMLLDTQAASTIPANPYQGIVTQLPPTLDIHSGEPTGFEFKKGDLIGKKYEVYDVLGEGGCGVVYLIYAREWESVMALKTLRSDNFEDIQTRNRFRQEAKVLVDLERHPFIVRAHFVDEVSGRIFIGMEYIVPNDHGLNSLDDYLRRQAPDITQSLRWSIQFCHGMEYAYSKGIRSHRDIKPANIMITQDLTVKISDFGLAGGTKVGKSMLRTSTNIHAVEDMGVGQTLPGTSMGTPSYMAPEQFLDASECDERSDIYSFGVVLFQMATGDLPFKTLSQGDFMQFWSAMFKLHSEAVVPSLSSPLSPIIQRCLMKDAACRYSTFNELRQDLEKLLQGLNGGVICLPSAKELEEWEWSNKGASLLTLNRFDEAIRCCDKAISIMPWHADAMNNKGVALKRLFRFTEAIHCFDQAIAIFRDPYSAKPWANKGFCLNSMGRPEDAIACFEQSLRLKPDDAYVWSSMADNLMNLRRFNEALQCLIKALELDANEDGAWSRKGLVLFALDRYTESMCAYDKALEINPMSLHAWRGKAICFSAIENFQESIICCDKILEISPRNLDALFMKAGAAWEVGNKVEVVKSCQRLVTLVPLNPEEEGMIALARKWIKSSQGT